MSTSTLQVSLFRLLALGAIALCAATAQTGAPYSSQENALGGRFGANGMGRPLGGIGRPNLEQNGHRGGTVPTAGYGYGYYVPGYFDIYGRGTGSSVASYTEDNPPVLAPVGPSQPTSAPAAPVVINQYFYGNAPVTGPVAYPEPVENAPSQSVAAQYGPARDESPGYHPQDENYFLIVFKDHVVRVATSYWLEGATLHYITTRAEHNQASLDLIDLAQTKSVNQARGESFEPREKATN